MGIAASSALRDDTGANGPAYGSLEALGGPRKFKKKPVLVLAPEELEAAHALFHEASAQLLGEDVERAPRPVSILGLAPMEDDPEELGHSDELADDVEDDMPSPEAVLALTRRKSAALPDEDFGALDGGMDYDTFGDQGDLPDDGLIDDGFINDGLDLSTRIFPSLPIRPELADEDAEYASPLPPLPSDQDTPDDGLTSDRDAGAELEPEPEPDPEPHSDLGSDLGIGAMPPPFAFRPVAPPGSLTASPAGEADVPAPPHPAPTRVPTPAEVGKAPLAAPDSFPEPTPDPAPEPAPSATPRPARFDELNPAKDYETPEEALDLDRWLAGEGAEASGPAAQEASAAGGSADEAGDEADDQEQSRTVSTDDDRVDGYAFMRDARPRHAVLSAAQQGRQSALRAKLLRESEREAARLQAQQQAPAGNSLIARMWHWLRDRLG